mmetsp:Transcript_42095/g.130418  ORF Transcript_42095/g.130418 Transcript_42095/m.130418 type:complete len:560 (+) Transcript_42095:91-1770(+)
MEDRPRGAPQCSGAACSRPASAPLPGSGAAGEGTEDWRHGPFGHADVTTGQTASQILARRAAMMRTPGSDRGPPEHTVVSGQPAAVPDVSLASGQETEDWRSVPLGRAGVGGNQPASARPHSHSDGGAMEDWRRSPLGHRDTLGGWPTSAAPPSGTAEEGMEDWRYGPLGRAGARASQPVPLPAPGSRVHEESEDRRGCAVPSQPAAALMRSSGTVRRAEGWRRCPPTQGAPHDGPAVSTAPFSGGFGEAAPRTATADAQGGGGMAKESGLEELVEKFRLTHNVPSTPACSLSGEVRETTLWGYWADGYEAMPELFRRCVDTWRHLNPHWDVRILDRTTLSEFVSEVDLPNRFPELPEHEVASACVRLALLSRYGGVWLDVSVILRSDLDSLCWRAIAAGEREAAAFYHPRQGSEALGGRDFIEAWCLATKPGNPFFLRWRDLLRELLHNRVSAGGLSGHPLCRRLEQARRVARPVTKLRRPPAKATARPWSWRCCRRWVSKRSCWNLASRSPPSRPSSRTRTRTLASCVICNRRERECTPLPQVAEQLPQFSQSPKAQ